MSTLLDISKDMQELLFKLDDMVMNGEEPPQELMDQVNELVTRQADKIDSCCGYIGHAKQMIEWLKNEKKQIDYAGKKYERAIDRLKSVAGHIMEKENVSRLEGMKGHMFSQRKSQAVHIEDPSKLPGRYTIVEVKPDKAAIKQALKDGEEIEGASLVTNISVQVK
jgi:hypothetical protein